MPVVGDIQLLMVPYHQYILVKNQEKIGAENITVLTYGIVKYMECQFMLLLPVKLVQQDG